MSTSRRSEIAPFHVMEVMRAAAQAESEGRRVLHLEVGQPSTPAPVKALQAAHHALDHDRLGYTSAAGIEPLRQRIAQWYRDRHHLDVAPERIVVTTGASGSCVLGFLALFDHGQRVGVLEPGYPCYRNDLQAFGIQVVSIPVGHQSGFRPTIEHLEAAGPLDGLILASPSNPTGTVLGDTELAQITTWAEGNGVRLVVDEIYHGITYGAEIPTALGYSDRTVVFNSFSKYFSMTGWRLGWIVADEETAVAIERLAQSFTISAPTLSQYAALAAFEATDELDAHVERYRANRRVVIDGLARTGLGPIAPADGAFYAWLDVSAVNVRLGTNGQELCRRWLAELDVAITPGIDFDLQRGDDFVRLSYAGATADMAEAMDRLVRWSNQNLGLRPAEATARSDRTNGR